MPACPECGEEVEVGAVVCPSCGVFPGTIPADGELPVVRAPEPPPSSQEPTFSFVLAVTQALFALFATLALAWWFHGPIDTTQPMENLVPEIALRLSRGFSISIPAVLLVGLWSAMSNRHDTWLGYGARYATFALLTTALTLGFSYSASRKNAEVASHPLSASAPSPMDSRQGGRLPSTGNPALDARLEALQGANSLVEQMRALEELQALDQPLSEAQARPQAKRPPAIDPNELAKCMSDHGAVLFGTSWADASEHQERAFGSAIGLIKVVDCESEPAYCRASRIRAYPTWEIAGRHYEGSRSLIDLARLSDCAPTGLGDHPAPSTSPTSMITRASYTWRDKNGVLRITSEPPPPDAQKIEAVE